MHDDPADDAADPPSVFVPSPQLVRLYVEQTAIRIGEMRSALATDNTHLLARAGHTVKGNSSYVAADAIGDLGGRIERLASDGQLQAAIALVDALEAEFIAMRPALLAVIGEVVE